MAKAKPEAAPVEEVTTEEVQETKVTTKWFRNKVTGLEWEVSHEGTIRDLEANKEEFELIEK